MTFLLQPTNTQKVLMAAWKLIDYQTFPPGHEISKAIDLLMTRLAGLDSVQRITPLKPDTYSVILLHARQGEVTVVSSLIDMTKAAGTSDLKHKLFHMN